MKIGKWNLEVFDSLNYVVYQKKIMGKDGIERVIEPAYFSRPNIILALKHIRNEMIDDKFERGEIQKLDSLLESIKSEDNILIERLKNLTQNITGALSNGK